MNAAASWGTGLLHFSQRSFISNAISFVLSIYELILRCGPPLPSRFMHTGNSIIIRAPLENIFETAANLELWPKILPHYRYIHYLERSVNKNIVVMAATRSGIPISWTSEQIIDRDRCEIHFNHLKAWTKGMRVVWTFKPIRDGVMVEILHDLHFRIRALAPVAEPIIGNFFISNIANKTLHCMKAYLETQGTTVAAK